MDVFPAQVAAHAPGPRVLQDRVQPVGQHLLAVQHREVFLVFGEDGDHPVVLKFVLENQEHHDEQTDGDQKTLSQSDLGARLDEFQRDEGHQRRKREQQAAAREVS